jgi:hypothetical protein
MTMGGVFLLLALAQEATPVPAATPDLLVEAWISTAGPYGEMWTLHLTPSGDARLRAYYSLDPSGSLMAEFDVGKEHLDRVQASASEQRFFDLPPELSPPTSPLHRPDLRLEITLGPRKHKVRVYDPDQMKSDVRVKRFMAVWTAVYGNLPVKPSW